MTGDDKIKQKETLPRLRPSVQVAFIAHGFPLMITVMVCWLDIPLLRPCEGVDPYPSVATHLVFELARWTKSDIMIPIALASGLPLANTLLYALLSHFPGKRVAVAWFWCVLAILVFAVLFTSWTAQRPLYLFSGCFT